MRTLSRYITSQFMTTFVAAFCIMTFVLSSGYMIQITDLLARGVSWRPIAKIFFYSLPEGLVFGIPVAVLVGSLLVFGRLSADSEITAIRASGISVLRVIVRPLLVSLLLTSICFHLNDKVVPYTHYLRRLVKTELGVQTPVDLLDEGRFIRDFEGMTVYVGKKRKNKIRDIRIYDLRDENIKREIRAQSGTITASETGTDLVLKLEEVRIDPFSDERPGAGFCDAWTITIPNVLRQGHYVRRSKDYPFWELYTSMRDIDARHPHISEKERASERMKLAVALQQRLVLSMACFAFAVLGMPLGIQSHRRESSVSIAISLAVMFGFYMFLIATKSLCQQPYLRPDLIVWTPVVLCFGFGIFLARRAS